MRCQHVNTGGASDGARCENEATRAIDMLHLFCDEHDPDPRSSTPIDQASFILLQEQLESVLHTLSEREKKVLQLRFGLLDDYPWTLEEVGRALGITPEQVRQIESATLEKLRYPSRMRRPPPDQRAGEGYGP